MLAGFNSNADALDTSLKQQNIENLLAQDEMPEKILAVMTIQKNRGEKPPKLRLGKVYNPFTKEYNDQNDSMIQDADDEDSIEGNGISQYKHSAGFSGLQSPTKSPGFREVFKHDYDRSDPNFSGQEQELEDVLPDDDEDQLDLIKQGGRRDRA